MMDENREIIEAIRQTRNEHIAEHGRNQPELIYSSPWEMAVFVDAALEELDRKDAEIRQPKSDWPISRSEARLTPALIRMRDARGSITLNSVLAPAEFYGNAAFIEFVRAAYEGVPAAIAEIGGLQVKLMDAENKVARLEAAMDGIPMLLGRMLEYIGSDDAYVHYEELNAEAEVKIRAIREARK